MRHPEKNLAFYRADVLQNGILLQTIGSQLHRMISEGRVWYRMEAKDGSFSSISAALYDEVKPKELIAYDRRWKVRVEFSKSGNQTKLWRSSRQRANLSKAKGGWQTILNNFRNM
jgi:hypothetical protein